MVFDPLFSLYALANIEIKGTIMAREDMEIDALALRRSSSDRLEADNFI
jgi:hypothetical protein